ncbi:MAG: DUF3696 domain-containing protein [Saprospiraceae bacterium]|nr:DUF3696 domain-containing protein [Saprospiraceae bacterium]MBK8546277.1 DUF3696 domain-containing protein [Saprospiraceae bacterium]
MLKTININGFKSFLDNNLTFGHLTLLTGLNSSGKSSIIQSILIFERAFKNNRDILLESHGSLKEIKNIYQKGNIKLELFDDLENNSILELIDEEESKGRYNFESKITSFPEIIYISANRYGPRNIVPIYNNSSLINKIGINGENLFQFIRSYESEILDKSLIHPKSEGNTVEFNIRGWLSVITPNVKFSYKIDEKSDTSYSLFNEHRSTNVGYGLSYSLSVIASLLISTLIPNCLVIIENPEAHLHPKGQTEIAKLISLCANFGTQIIVETHSDHIFDSVRVNCKELSGFSEKVHLHWFELNEYNNSIIKTPVIDNKGKLNEWPEGLFDQFEINASKLI